MGRELICTVVHDGKTAKGKALLETAELLFRGDIRLRIPFAALKSVTAKNGELRLEWDSGAAVFNLGDQAEKWAEKVLHPKSTAEKLGLKAGLVISTVAIGDAAFLRDLRADAKIFSNSKLLKNSDLIFFGAAESDDLGSVSELAAGLASHGALWIVYPKGRQEIKEGQVLAAGRAAGLVDVKVVKFSDTHTALKFVRPTNER